MAVISQGGPAELPAAVFICSQKEHGLIACEKQRAEGSENSLFSFCCSFLAHGACVGMVSSFLGGDGVLPGLAQETDDQNLWSMSAPLPGSDMLFLKGVLGGWFTEATATS